MNKTVALKYEPELDNAPKILAKGEGEIGKYILELAQKNHVPIYKNDKLLESLYRLKQNQEIPPELYQIVAEIFSFVYALRNKK
ncbi:MAG: EscU/YscU/HrcU family type III secretion system export apparatus switch protein [Brevinematales bacterium]|nr:EscU/YscU/HrcU family type III secretion system export apparatus switch protein [Brevinematales bacterium]